jgi:hypothetical protein
MKRDLELVRKLLFFFFDEKEGTHHVQVPPIPGYDESVIQYHLGAVNVCGEDGQAV